MAATTIFHQAGLATVSQADFKAFTAHGLKLS